jgi:arylsulfatase A-like enzyme
MDIPRRQFLASSLSLAGWSATRTWAGNEKRPNIVLILMDDMGWTDLSCFGSTFYETPNIDRLCNSGMKFTHAYSTCTVCSPTRASLLTGKYPARLHLTDWIPGHERDNARLLIPPFNHQLPLEETTIAEVLQKAGYTTASIGKWHLGTEPYYPEKQGFDINIAGTKNGQPPSYFSPYKIATLPEGPDGEYLTDRLTDEAITFVTANKNRPFFLYWPHFSVHTPLQAKKGLIEKYKTKIVPGQKQSHPIYAAMIEDVDRGVGRLMETLKSMNLLDDTIVIFTSDNGGLVSSTSNAPLRGGKGTAYEGGVRVPLIFHFPAKIKPGQICSCPVASIDLFPTLLALAGIKNLPDLDGCSMIDLLKKPTASLRRSALYWHYPHYHPLGATPYSAVLKGSLRLIEFLEDGKIELYDLEQDPGEQHDVSQERPEQCKKLLAELGAWRRSVDAQMPTLNPAYKP